MAGLAAMYRLELSVLARVAVAMLLGAAIGLERETISGYVLRADPIRLIVAVSTGVSFLGAGTIPRRGSEQQVEGLATAASLLLAAAAGMSSALELWVLAIGVTVLALLVLPGVSLIERALWRRQRRDTRPDC